jgi:hypothetical protein
VIKRGWDWLGLTPRGGDFVGGLVEVPALAAALTLNHIALSVALALAPVAVEPADHHTFITSFLARWGSAMDAAPVRCRRPRSIAHRPLASR